MKYIYGPVESRRLGKSLGISLTPRKICSFDCIYCQLGPTIKITKGQKVYVSQKDVITELKSWLGQNKKIAGDLKYITLAGFGEPTLNTWIGRIILEIKKITRVPVAVITNSSLLHLSKVRQRLLQADLIVPSLDAVTQEMFEKIDCPTPGVKIEDVIDGLISLRREFKGKIWLEVMLVKGVNDDLAYIKKIKEVAQKIRPDKIQLNSPVRTVNPKILSVDKAKLAKIKGIFGSKCEIA